MILIPVEVINDDFREFGAAAVIGTQVLCWAYPVIA